MRCNSRSPTSNFPLPEAAGEAQKIIQAQIEATDREIDGLVYERYGLTADEIAIVEGRV